MPKLCVLCSRNVTDSRYPGVQCAGVCQKIYHASCAGLSDDLLKSIKVGSTNWNCMNCRAKARRSFVSGTDVTVPEPISDNPDLREVLRVLKDVQSQISDISNSQRFLAESIDEVNTHIKILREEKEVLKSKIADLDTKHINLLSKVHYLEADADKFNQYLIRNNLVISGLPAIPNAKKGLVVNSFHKLVVAVNVDDIKSVIINTTRNHITKESIVSYVVEISSIDVKNEILKHFYAKKIFNTSELSVALPVNFNHHRINVMNQFTPFQSRLYNETKKIKTDFKFLYLWYKDNKILLREKAGSRIFHVASRNDIVTIKKLLSTDASKSGPSTIINLSS